MQYFENIPLLRNALRVQRLAQKRIAFVPTMGNLHQGHLALVERAQALSDVVVVSIFVNPMQFNNAQDLANYPRTLEHDLELLESAGVNMVFAPQVNDLYPEGIAQQTRVEVPQLGEILEGALRPGHFSGVATVVTKLFNLVQADVAVFGEKDYQQLALIRKLTHDLLLSTEIIAHPTVREHSGLAMSSRNNRLNEAQRQQAPFLAHCMFELAAALKRDNFIQLQQQGAKALKQQGFRVDAIDIVDADNLMPLSLQSRRAVILMAAYLGEVRLIDNTVVELNHP